MTIWCPDWELERLLQALEQETLAADEDDLRRILSEAGLPKAESLRQVARVLRAAAAEYEEPAAEAPQATTGGLGTHQARWPH